MDTLEGKAREGKLLLLDILPRSRIKSGDRLHKEGAKFRPFRDTDGSFSYCADLSGDVWERVSCEGSIENHAYFLRATTRQRIQSMGFGEENERYFNIIEK